MKSAEKYCEEWVSRDESSADFVKRILDDHNKEMHRLKAEHEDKLREVAEVIEAKGAELREEIEHEARCALLRDLLSHEERGEVYDRVLWLNSLENGEVVWIPHRLAGRGFTHRDLERGPVMKTLDGILYIAYTLKAEHAAKENNP